MHDRIQSRLAELRAEYAKGEETLAGLDQQAASVRATMLRISGAIQVLEELSHGEGGGEGGGGNGTAAIGERELAVVAVAP